MPQRFRWSKSLDPDDQAELERLRSFADSYEFDGRHHVMDLDLEAIRRVQLHHTLLHEVGHWVDMLEKVEWPAAREDLDVEEWEQLLDAYHNRPRREREDFAHRYADRMRDKLTRTGVLPFTRKVKRRTLRADGLRLLDFLPPDRC